MELKLGNLVRLKKKHPCGSFDWEVVRLGADIGLKCLKCHHRMLMPHGDLERQVKASVHREQE